MAKLAQNMQKQLDCKKLQKDKIVHDTIRCWCPLSHAFII